MGIRMDRVGFRFADIFAGLGGFRLALEGLGGKCVLSSEIDPKARLTYHANYGDWPSGDVRAIRAEDVPEHDILCGGFPCQSFSIAGGKLGFQDESRGTLFFEIVRLLKGRMPAAAFLENVRHLESHDGGLTFAVIRRTLEGLGYRVFSAVLNASLYGAPTARKRIYIVAFRSDLGIERFAFPSPTHEPVRLADVLMPDLETGKYVVSNHPIHIDREAIAAADGRVVLRTVRVGRVGERRPAKQGYRVYSPMGHAVTFLCRGGGIGAQTGLYLVNGRVRRLAPREMARAMGFPDSFVIPSCLSYEHARRQFGNSVVVPLVRLIAERIIQALRGAPSHLPSPNALTVPSPVAAPHATP